MKIEEPKVEFVQIDPVDDICTGSGGYVTCSGTGAKMNQDFDNDETVNG